VTAFGTVRVVFPECFVSLYPSGGWAAAAATWADGCDELWERMVALHAKRYFDVAGHYGRADVLDRGRRGPS
jgi:hypothetical protein